MVVVERNRGQEWILPLIRPSGRRRSAALAGARGVVDVDDHHTDVFVDNTHHAHGDPREGGNMIFISSS